jgi:hypothetical protein
MAFRTKLDYSDNRQIKQRERTETTLSGTTVFGMPFSALTSGPDLTATAQTSQYFGVVSSYSGNSATTVFTWGIPGVSAVDSSISALTPSNSGVSQNISAIFSSSSTTIIDGNLVNLTYSGVSATNLYPITMSEPTPGNYSGTVSTDFFIYSAETLDFTGRTIWVDNTEILRTKKLIVSDNPQIGYVLTSNSEGMATWQSVSAVTSGTTFWSASTGNFAIVTESAGNLASGDYALAEGNGTTAIGLYSHAEGIGTIASGNSSHAEGSFTVAGDDSAHAEGTLTKALGEYSHSEGESTTASSQGSHAEGSNTTASGLKSHAEGSFTVASGITSHAEGNQTTASGNYSHAEGSGTIASGVTSHAEGFQTTAESDYSHAEGYNTTASGLYSHAEGRATIASGNYSHAQGYQTSTTNQYSHAEGQFSTASGQGSHSEGGLTRAIGGYSHSEGYATTASGDSSHAEGGYTTASGLISHAEGEGTKASGYASHVEGYYSQSIGAGSHAEGGYFNGVIIVSGGTASGIASHAEGLLTTASGLVSHAEGGTTIASGAYSHSEGFLTTASGGYSHAEGAITIASGTNSHSEGGNTTAEGNFSHAEGAGSYSVADFSHAEGYTTTAIGYASHAEGSNTTASGDTSHSEGFLTTSVGSYSHAGGSGSTASGLASFIHSVNSVVTGARSVVIGGQGITGTTADTVYVPDLVIDGLVSTDPIATDASGRIVAGVSDIRLKRNINTLPTALDVIKNLRGVSFEYTEESNMGSGIRFGFIAQEVQEIVPELVRSRAKSDGMLNLNYSEIIPWIVEAIKEMIAPDGLILESQTIAAEDNNIELNYNGTTATAIGGGISLINGINNGINAEFKLNSEGSWVTNNSIAPLSLIIPEYSPVSSLDNYGKIGDITRDDNYLYIKGSAGWKRSSLESF